MSDFGLVQITRQRLRPSITTTFSGPNAGNGEPSEADEKAQKAERERQQRQRQREREARQREQQQKQRQQKASRRDEERSRQERSSAPEEPQKAHTNNGQPARDKKKPAHRPGRQAAATTPERSPSELLEELETWVANYKAKGGRAVTLHVHPFTAAYLNRRVPTQPTRWFMKHLVRVRVEVDDKMRPMAYRFMDPRSGENITDRFSGKEPQAKS